MLADKQKERRAYKLRALPLFDKIISDKSPSITELEKLISINERKNEPILTNHDSNALRLKHQALTTEPTAIEKTMSPEQLFNARNPLWASGYTIQELYDWFKFRKPLDGYNRVDEIIRVSEKINNAIKEQYKTRKEVK